MPIYITGDTHGTFYLKKILPESLKNIPEGSTIIILGDFGLIYKNTRTEIEEKYLNVLENLPFTFCFIDGEKDNLNQIHSYPQESWNGGLVNKVRSNILYLKRGEIFNIENKKLLAMGGASSYQVANLIKGTHYWDTENISDNDIGNAGYHLKKNDMSVDIILSHTAPSEIAKFIAKEKVDEIKINDMNCKQLDLLKDIATYDHWYFGHFHYDISIDKKHTAVFNKLIQIH